MIQRGGDDLITGISGNPGIIVSIIVLWGLFVYYHFKTI